MNMIRRVVLGLGICLIVGLRAVPQQAVPPPPKPADSGPSLEATMKFIQDKLNDLGPISYTLDNTDDGTVINLYRSTVSSVVASAANCNISYKWKDEVPGILANEYDVDIPLKEVESIKIDTIAAPDAYKATAIRPQTYVLLVHGAHNDQWDSLLFQDDALADRVAKALIHAIELCGGGNKDPF
jgi:hypothetical protein